MELGIVRIERSGSHGPVVDCIIAREGEEAVPTITVDGSTIPLADNDVGLDFKSGEKGLARVVLWRDSSRKWIYTQFCTCGEQDREGLVISGADILDALFRNKIRKGSNLATS